MLRLGGLQRFLERVVELVEHLDHVFLGRGDVVELVLHVRGELQVEDLGELLDQEVGHDHAQVGREEPPLLLLDVAAVLDRLDDRGVGAGPADVLLLEGLDQRGLAVAGRRLGEVLGRVEAVQVERLADGQGGQELVFLLAAPGGQTRRWPSNFRTLPCALKMPVAGGDRDVGDREDGRGHLAGDEPARR